MVSWDHKYVWCAFILSMFVVNGAYQCGLLSLHLAKVEKKGLDLRLSSNLLFILVSIASIIPAMLKVEVYLALASYPGSKGEGKKKPGTH